MVVLSSISLMFGAFLLLGSAAALQDGEPEAVFTVGAIGTVMVILGLRGLGWA